MYKDPFVILGVDENVGQSELFEAYKNMRNKYAALRFEPGEVGNEACVRMEEIEVAYTDAREILRNRLHTDQSYDNLEEADRAIKEKRMDDAQLILDNCGNRTARWHYLQAAVFYSKNWQSDAIKQMEFACSKDPGNTKYSETKRVMLEEMLGKSTAGNTTTGARSAQDESFYRGEKQGRSYSNYNDTDPRARGCSMCDCCSSLICADCCCECMGGDLISCC